MGLLTKNYIKTQNEIKTLLDNYIDMSNLDPFSMIVKEVTQENNSLLVHGVIESGSININDKIIIDGKYSTNVIKIKLFNNFVDYAEKGNDIDVILNIPIDNIKVNSVITK